MDKPLESLIYLTPHFTYFKTLIPLHQIRFELLLNTGHWVLPAACFMTTSKNEHFFVHLYGSGHNTKYFMDNISCNHGHFYPHFRDEETNLI